MKSLHSRKNQITPHWAESSCVVLARLGWFSFTSNFSARTSSCGETTGLRHGKAYCSVKPKSGSYVEPLFSPLLRLEILNFFRSEKNLLDALDSEILSQDMTSLEIKELPSFLYAVEPRLDHAIAGTDFGSWTTSTFGADAVLGYFLKERPIDFVVSSLSNIERSWAREGRKK